MDIHVLVLAMSTLTIRPNRLVNQYSFDGTDTFKAIGQLEPIPLLLHKTGQKITHILLLETEDTLKPVELQNTTWEDIKAKSREEGYPIAEDLITTPSAVSFFLSQMKNQGIDAQFIPIPINLTDTGKAFERLSHEIRNLYKQCNGGDWKLWLDIHGGFREISMLMFALMQMLSVDDMQNIARLTDGMEVIPVTDVYTVQFDNSKNSNSNRINKIIQMTDIFRNLISESVKSYMNYGQYLHSYLKPYEGNKPYAFISYRHKDAEKERLTVLSILKKYHYRYWYDDGIHLNDNWKEVLEKKNKGCSIFILLLTKTYMDSEECKKELNEAIKDKKSIFIIALDDINMFAIKELEPFTKYQHIQLKSETSNNALQESRLIEKLQELDSQFRCILDESKENATE